ncbi:MAG: toll/interleukin-1 receptor domain-containing protein, partial [Acidimicrobiia bacterium]|nr:toll/interleukin-1 receptor domain-containing protein [Acidimicrobiia bacterium]
MAEVYDGFISYSHAADDLLAPRLQAGLQRFAKPWWKRRALRVFRDESSLSANPHLWSSITDALDGSEWFVLLLSEEAARSEWVGREVEYWLQHKPADRILPVVTDGEFGWEDGDISRSSTAAPPAVSGVFSEEPRWVDLRWARTDEHLDLSNPRFSDAVADIASALRGVPKDELASEEVRQHRRTIRTAWAAGVVVLLLAIAAAVG